MTAPRGRDAAAWPSAASTVVAVIGDPIEMCIRDSPTPGGWLYFELVEKDGTEQFSDTFAEQLAAEALAESRGLP